MRSVIAVSVVLLVRPVLSLKVESNFHWRGRSRAPERQPSEQTPAAGGRSTWTPHTQGRAHRREHRRVPSTVVPPLPSCPASLSLPQGSRLRLSLPPSAAMPEVFLIIVVVVLAILLAFGMCLMVVIFGHEDDKSAATHSHAPASRLAVLTGMQPSPCVLLASLPAGTPRGSPR
jgi:hypothetical protein